MERDLVPEWRLKYLDYKVRTQGRSPATHWARSLTAGTAREKESQGH
jgi:hypothetical protein